MAVRDAYTLADITKMSLPVDVVSTKGFLGSNSQWSPHSPNPTSPGLHDSDTISIGESFTFFMVRDEPYYLATDIKHKILHIPLDCPVKFRQVG